MRYRASGRWENLNMTPTVDQQEYVDGASDLLTPGSITVAGVSFCVGFSIFYSDKANAWIVQAIKYAIDYVMGLVTELSFEMFGEYWKSEQKKSSEKQMTAYAKSMDALNEVIKLEKNQRLNRTLTTYQTQCRGVEVAEELRNAQYHWKNDHHTALKVGAISAMGAGVAGHSSFSGLYTPEEYEVFDVNKDSSSPGLGVREQVVEQLLKESLATPQNASVVSETKEAFLLEMRHVAFLNAELNAATAKGLSILIDEKSSLQSQMAYSRLATIACRGSVVTGLATRNVLNRYKKEHGGNGRNHALKFMVDQTYYSEEWQGNIKNFADPVPAAAEWVKLLGLKLEFLREEYRNNEEAILVLSTLILNRLDSSEFVRGVVGKAVRLTNGDVK